jgi:hypothetical protein
MCMFCLFAAFHSSCALSIGHLLAHSSRAMCRVTGGKTARQLWRHAIRKEHFISGTVSHRSWLFRMNFHDPPRWMTTWPEF